MELRTLRYFLAAASEENITRAADILHVTQPTLSRQLMDLERELGTTLMYRTPSVPARGRRRSWPGRSAWSSPLWNGALR